jgi:hypothetical protein
MGAEYSRFLLARMPTSAGSAKIAPSRLCTGRSAALALALAPATMRAKTDSIILRDIVKSPIDSRTLS